MTVFYCKACCKAYMVSGDPGAVIRLVVQNSYPCITPLCRGRLIKGWSDDSSVIKPTVVPLEDFYRAINGMGSSEERATLNAVSKLFTTSKIVDIVGRDVGDPVRVILEEIIFEDGTRMHFANSSHGACVYRIESRSSND